MAQPQLEKVTDFGDYTCGKELSELLKQISLSDVRLSPDGRHIHVILRKPRAGLVTFDKHERPQFIQSHKRLDLGPARTVPVVDVVYLDHNNSNYRKTAVSTVAVVYENGKTEFWKFQECKAGWHLVQTSDLCNSPRARVVSVSACSNLIIWCEERPPSESSSVLSATRNNLRYCICKRDFEVEEGAVSLGGVKIALHNNPRYTVISSGEYVYLLPDSEEKPLSSISKFFLSWSPQHDTFRVSSTCKNTLLKKDSPAVKESDFKRLVTDCLGYLSSSQPPEIYGVSPTAGGGLLLLLSTCWVCLLQKDGTLRQVYKLADNCSVNSGTHNSLHVYQDTLVLVVGQKLYLIDLKCGRELGRISLKREGLLYVNRVERQSPYLLSESGLYVVVRRDTDTRGCDANSKLRPSLFGTVESICPGLFLVEAVFEEACKYYQQRSLSSTQLTVDALKEGGKFQAPISLASILRNYLSAGGRQKGAEVSQGGGGGSGFVAGQDKLHGSLEAELKALVSLEDVKLSLVRGSVKEVEALCESLVQQEVARLLSSSELDRDALLYLNSIFRIFPCQAWRAAQATLQLRCNGEGSLSSKAPPEVWKTVLSPTQTPGTPANHPYTNGEPKLKLNLDTNSITNSNPGPTSSTFPAANLALPVFELLCHSVFHFQPGWLPRFLELAQQQQGLAGLGLSLASSSWSYSSGRGGDGGESSVPLYKRALSVLSSLETDRNRSQDLEVELLLVSGRPNAVLQALRILMSRQQWEQVIQVAQRFCKQSPLLNKEIFTTLLCEVAQHRDLDPYLDLLWALCPEDLTVTSILNLVLKNIPSPNLPCSSSSPKPFAEPHSSQLTIGLLKPLLSKVLQREAKPSQRYADILQSPSFPPPTPPRQAMEQPRAGTEPSTDSPHGSSITTAALTGTPEQQPCSQTNVQGARMQLPANPV
ncbi:Hermansky-Pudlak syndrome 6 protein [Myripristis murdjan]|uniref:Hermansky-Pudlak syndrome 6 protein n=1 Tax=Myripristis murdjan TaxID=586833 RepID=UPI001176213B|nr:Hermansky-Pudlak syndrome 6 protein [Myripristis murdjan]